MAGGAVGFFKDEITAPGRIAVGIRLIRQNAGEEETIYIQMNELHTNVGYDTVPSVATGMFYMAAGDYVEVWAFQHMEIAGPRETFILDDLVLYQHIINGWLVKVGN